MENNSSGRGHVLRLRPKQGFPPVVVGDFNAEPDSDEMRFLRGGHALGDRSVYFNDAFRVAGDAAHMANPLTGGGIRDKVLANAPAAEHGFFGVPKVIE